MVQACKADRSQRNGSQTVLERRIYFFYAIAEHMSADLNSLLAPNDDKLFEQLCQHVLEHRFKTLSGHAYGRPGQEQHGVDFYIEIPAGGGASGDAAVQIIGIQCKHKDRLLEGELGVKELEDEVNKAKGFKPALTTLIVATSALTDTKPQDKARELTAEHQKRNSPLFSIEVWFWEKIRGEFSKDPGLKREILERFYRNLIPAQPAQHSVLHQLPTKPAHFTGRDEELAELENEIASAHPDGATISGVRTKLHGAPGVGKTALATVLAHQLKNSYPSAQLYLNLRGAGADIHGQHSTAVKPMTPAEAMQSIIHAFHPEEKLPEELDKLSVKYNGVLNEAGRVLLFLDNAADAAQVRPLLPPDNCLLLVTSRAQFSLPGLSVRNLDCLRPEMSQKLLRDLSPRITGCENEAAELCGHLPLALKVFAGVVNDMKLYAVLDLLKRLRDGREKLAPVDAAFQISYDLLADDLRRRLVLLTVFPASFDLPAAAAIWNEGGSGSPLPTAGESQAGEQCARSDASYQPMLDSARETMQLMVNASLVEWNQADDRFRLHDLVRQFCDDKLIEMQRSAAKFRHAMHYREIGNRADLLYISGGANVFRGLNLFDQERINIEAAFEWLQTQRNEESIALLISLVNAVTYTGGLRFHPFQQIDWLRAEHDAARKAQNRKQEGASLLNLGNAYRDLGDIRNAIRFHEQSLAIKREIGDRCGEGVALACLGMDYSRLGEELKAIEFYKQWLVIVREIKDWRETGNVFACLGVSYVNLGDLFKGIRLFKRSLVVARKVGDWHGEIVALGNLGNAYLRLGNTKEAIEYTKQVLVNSRKIGDRQGEGIALTNLGNAYADLGEVCKANEFYEQRLVIAREIGDRRGESAALWNSSLALGKLGDHAQAILRAEAALKIFEVIEDPNTAKVRATLVKWSGQAK